MPSIEELRDVRMKKRNALEAHGVPVYPIESRLDKTLAEAARRFRTLSRKKSLTLGGRVMGIRGQGGLVFFDLFDGTGKFQALLKRDGVSAEALARFEETVDVGDFLEVTGDLFLTKRKEKTILVGEWRMLAKALRPLPEKWHGLQDVEERFRKRYLDLLMNEAVRSRFILRSRVISAFRKLLDAAGFLEVETSILQPLAGGANAEPFQTHHNALDIDLYLRIAPELDLKKLLIGGYPKIYEIGRSFRNEGIDVTHNPEFTTIEWYETWSDARRARGFVETIMRSLVKAVSGKARVTFGGNGIDFGKPFSTATYYELLQRYALIVHPERASAEELRLTASRQGVAIGERDSAERIMDAIFKKTVRPKLIAPTFVTEYPKLMLPLAKATKRDPSLADAFQLYAGGIELVKAFSELNDPIEQRTRFAREEEKKDAGDREAQQNDEAFLEALEYGMPPAAGVGIGIERLVMLLSDTHNIREVVFFPTLRPRR